MVVHSNFGFQIRAGLGYSGFHEYKTEYFLPWVHFRKDRNRYWPSMQIPERNYGQAQEVGELLTNGWGDGPRMSPSVSGEKVYALGGKGNLVCVQI